MLIKHICTLVVNHARCVTGSIIFKQRAAELKLMLALVVISVVGSKQGRAKPPLPWTSVPDTTEQNQTVSRTGAKKKQYYTAAINPTEKHQKLFCHTVDFEEITLNNADGRYMAYMDFMPLWRV